MKASRKYRGAHRIQGTAVRLNYAWVKLWLNHGAGGSCQGSEEIEVEIAGWGAVSRGIVGDDRELVAHPDRQGDFELSL